MSFVEFCDKDFSPYFTIRFPLSTIEFSQNFCEYIYLYRRKGLLFVMSIHIKIV